MKFGKEGGSHLPVLMKLISITDGPILELGTGIFSTPYLHWACFDKKRKLVSYERQPEYFEQVKQYICDFHEIYPVEKGCWGKIDFSSKHWSIALIDHTPSKERKNEAKNLANLVDYVVLHDSDDIDDTHYKYSEIYPLFKYRYDYDKVYPRTTVLSNFKDLSNLKDL